MLCKCPIVGLDEKIATDVAITTVVNLAQKVRGIVFIPLITKILGTAAYGAFVQVIVVADLLSAIFRFGLDSALVRFIQPLESTSEKAQLYSTLCLISVGSGTLVAGVVSATAPQISRLTLGTGDYTEVFAVGGLLIPIYIAQEMARNYYRAEMRVKTYSLLDGVKTYLSVATVIVVVLVLDLGLRELIYALTLVEGTFALVLQGIVVRTIGLRRPSLAGLTDQFEYSLPIMIVEFMGMSQTRVDRLLIGFFLGPAAVGVYAVAYTVARLLRLFALPVRVTLFPELSRLWEGEQREECRRIVYNASRYFVILSVPSVAGVYLMGPSLLSYLSTDVVANEAVILLPVLAMATLLIGVETLYRQLFFAAERTRIVSIIRVSGSILNVVLNVLLIPILGVIGAALTTLVTFGMAFAALFWLARTTFDVSIDARSIVLATVATAVMTSVVVALDITHFLLILAASPIVYFATMYVIGGVSRGDIEFVISLVQSARSG